MKRKILDQLLKWKTKSNGDTAVLIDGARRVGKSYIAEEFGKAYYKSYLLIDFNKVSDSIKQIFYDDMDDLDTFFSFLSAYYGVKLYPRESLIVFDEVQLFPRARSVIKYLVADGRYDYIETGSLVSIRENSEGILIPSEEFHLKMYPMDFEEFLWAMGNETLMDLIRQCYEKRMPLGQALHRKAMNYFRQYLVVGGMPQAVLKYAKTHDFNDVDEAKRLILDLYKEDIAKHAGKYKTKVREIFDGIPSQLQKHEKKYRFSSLEKNAKARNYEDAVFWLSDAMVTNNCYNSTEPSVGLSMNCVRTTLKCYMADTGLLISHAFDENTIVSEEIYKKILFSKLEINEGMLIENIVAQMLVCNSHKLYFYSNPGIKDTSSRMEIDFLIAKKTITNRHNISPIEVKSGKRYTTRSLDKFINKYGDELATPYIIHTLDYKEENGIVYLPIYMTPLL